MLNTYSKFLNELFSKLEELEIDTTELTLDHLGYQTSSSDDYDGRKEQILKDNEEISEAIVGGRRVGIYKLIAPLVYNEMKIEIVELIEPKEGQVVESAWEHAEFTLKISLEDFMKKYPELEWDTRAIDRDEFPMLILPLGDGMSVKFPRRGVMEEANRVDS